MIYPLVNGKIGAAEIAENMDKIEYRDMVRPTEQLKQVYRDAKDKDCVVIYGMSDDLLEFRGAIDEEVGAFEGTSVLIDLEAKDLLQYPAEDECINCPLLSKHIEASCIEVISKWDHEGYTWYVAVANYRLWKPFVIYEDGEPYCRGIVVYLGEK